MWPLQDPDLVEQHDCNPAASPLADLRPMLHKQWLNVSPGQIAAGGAGTNRLKGALMPTLHLFQYSYEQVPRARRALAFRQYA
jgi:hypothetical protein